jgi:hypothetical protein
MASCEKHVTHENTVSQEQMDAAKRDSLLLIESSQTTEPLKPEAIKVKVDFLEHKDLLDIILLLPDSVFDSWGWDIKDRRLWYNEIKEHNFYMDTTPHFLNLNYIEPHTASFSIVDGSWKISIYKTTDNSFIVITDDIVGDGNLIYSYEVKDNILEAYLDKNILFDYIERIKRDADDLNCTEKYEELSMPLFTFDFSEKNKVEIESSWYLMKEDYMDCLVGNSVVYVFDPSTKKFDVEKVYWKTKQKN